MLYLIIFIAVYSIFCECVANNNLEPVKLVSKEKQKYRLHYHVMASSGWINDPNGFSYYDGEYHIFFQHNPYNVVPGNIHWGHAKSNDLVHWKHLPEALTPDKPYDLNGCFSGTGIADKKGKLLLFYTGNVDETNTTYYSSQSQNLASTTDGVHFEKYQKNPIIPFPPEDGGEAFRDPKVWIHDRRWFLLMGNQKKDNGRVVLYKSNDPETVWEYVGVLASSNGSLGYMWECPDFFRLNDDDTHVLLFSPQGIEREGDKFANLYQTGYVTGKYSYEDNNFQHGDFYEIDNGHDFYAMQTMESPDGRRIGIAWMDMWESDFPEADEGWAGALTIPRELILQKDGKIIQRPIREMELLRKRNFYQDKIIVNGKTELCEITAAEISIKANLCEGLEEFGIVLDDNVENKVYFYINQSDHTFNLDRGDDDTRRTSSSGNDNEITLTSLLTMNIFLDASSIEVFLNGGKTTFTSRIYPKKTPLLSVYSKGDCSINAEISIYELENIWNT